MKNVEGKRTENFMGIHDDDDIYRLESCDLERFALIWIQASTAINFFPTVKFARFC